MTDNIAFVRSMYAAFGKGDVQTILANVDPAILWESHGDPQTIPWAGKRVGPDGALAFFQALGGNLDFELFEPGTFFPSGDNVIVRGRSVARHKHGGHGAFDSPWMHIFTIRDGRVAHFEEFYDTAAIERALAA